MLSNRCRRFAFSLGAFALLLPLAGGCGSGKGTLSGEVTLDGKPLPSGTITFYPAKKSLGNPLVSAITDGKYSVSGVPVGNMKVAVETTSIKRQADTFQASASSSNMARSMGQRKGGGALPPEAKKAMDEEKKSAEESKQKSKELMDKYRPIPGKYENKDTSGLSVEVKPGSNPPYNVSLSSK